MITETFILVTIDKAETCPEPECFRHHDTLQSIDDDLKCDDARAREGQGLSEHPPRIEPAALELLNEYLSTH